MLLYDGHFLEKVVLFIVVRIGCTLGLHASMLRWLLFAFLTKNRAGFQNTCEVEPD